MGRKKVAWGAILVLPSFLACDINDDDRVVLVERDSLSQVELPTSLSRQEVGVAMKALGSQEVVTTGIGLTLLGTVQSPSYDGITLQATDVVWRGDRVYASYNVRGDRFLGAIQIIDVHDPSSPSVVGEAIYPHTDISRIRMAGDRVFAAAADELLGATFEQFVLDDLELDYLGYRDLPSYSATYLSINGNNAYVSYGDVQGGHAIFDLSSGEADFVGSIDAPDARWVEEVGDFDLIGVTGSPGILRRYNGAIDGEVDSALAAPVLGATVGAPTWATRSQDLLYLSSDRAGLQIYNIADMSLVGSLPTTGTANGSALANDRRVAFLANGEEGLVVADVLDASAPEILASIDISSDSGSANAVATSGEYVALADGLGGVKIIHYDRVIEAPPNDCDGDGIADELDPDDDNDGVLDEDDAQPCAPDISCEEGTTDHVAAFVGDFYNLPCDHPDVDGPITGLVLGTEPWDFDWFTDLYYSFSIERESLLIDYSQDYFPVDEGLCGDPFYFAAHWYTTAIASEAGEYTFEMGSDDDSWLYIDGVQQIDLGGIHAIARTTKTVTLSEGAHRIDIYFAERHVTQSGLEFEVTGLPSATARLETVQHLCLDDEEDADQDGQINAVDIAPLTKPHS